MFQSFNKIFNAEQYAKINLYKAIEGFKREVRVAEVNFNEIVNSSRIDPNPGRSRIMKSKLFQLEKVLKAYNNENVKEYLEQLLRIIIVP